MRSCNGNLPSAPDTQTAGGSQIDLTNGVNGCGQNQAWTRLACARDNNWGCTVDSNGNINGYGGTGFRVGGLQQTPACSTNPSGNYPLVGFATINLTSAACQLATATVIHRNSSTPTPPPVGAGCYGTDCRVVLVE